MYSNNYSSKETLEHRINYVINWKRTINGKDYNLQQIADALLEGDTKVGEDSHDFIQPMFPIYTVGMDGKAYFENEEEFQRFEESVGYLENGILNKYLESYLTYIGFPPGKEPDKNNMIYKNVENGRYDHNFARITRVIESVCLQARALLMGFIHDSMDKTDKIRDEVEQNKNIKQVENAIKAVSMADEFYRELIDVAEKNPNISSDTLKFWRNNSLVKDASYLLSSLRQKKGNLIKNNPIISADEFFYCEKCNNLLDGQEIIFKQKKDAEIFRLLSMSGNDFAFKRDVIRRAINSGVITNRGIFFEDIIKAANDSKFAASKSNELYSNLEKSMQRQDDELKIEDISSFKRCDAGSSMLNACSGQFSCWEYFDKSHKKPDYVKFMETSKRFNVYAYFYVAEGVSPVVMEDSIEQREIVSLNRLAYIFYFLSIESDMDFKKNFIKGVISEGFIGNDSKNLELIVKCSNNPLFALETAKAMRDEANNKICKSSNNNIKHCESNVNYIVGRSMIDLMLGNCYSKEIRDYHLERRKEMIDYRVKELSQCSAGYQSKYNHVMQKASIVKGFMDTRITKERSNIENTWGSVWKKILNDEQPIKNGKIANGDFYLCKSNRTYKSYMSLNEQEKIFRQNKCAEIFKLLSMSGNDFAFKRDVIRRAINSGVITNRGIFFEDIIKAANDSKFAASKSNELYDNLDKQKSVKIQNNDTEWKEIRNDNIKIRRSRIYNVNKQNNGVKRRIRSARIQSIKKHNKKMQDIIRRIKRRQLLRIQNGNAMVMQKF